MLCLGLLGQPGSLFMMSRPLLSGLSTPSLVSVGTFSANGVSDIHALCLLQSHGTLACVHEWLYNALRSMYILPFVCSLAMTS